MNIYAPLLFAVMKIQKEFWPAPCKIEGEESEVFDMNRDYVNVIMRCFEATK